jgi:hypothetical protein
MLAKMQLPQKLCTTHLCSTFMMILSVLITAVLNSVLAFVNKMFNWGGSYH